MLANARERCAGKCRGARDVAGGGDRARAHVETVACVQGADRRTNPAPETNNTGAVVCPGELSRSIGRQNLVRSTIGWWQGQAVVGAEVCAIGGCVQGDGPVGRSVVRSGDNQVFAGGAESEVSTKLPSVAETLVAKCCRWW